MHVTLTVDSSCVIGITLVNWDSTRDSGVKPMVQGFGVGDAHGRR